MARPAPSAKPLAQKLLLKPGQRLLILEAPPAVDRLLRGLPAGATTSRHAGGEYGRVLLFARDRATLDAGVALAASAPAAATSGGLPKSTGSIPAGINRDRGWDTLRGAGWRPVTRVAVDDDWSALRFRPHAG